MAKKKKKRKKKRKKVNHIYMEEADFNKKAIELGISQPGYDAHNEYVNAYQQAEQLRDAGEDVPFEVLKTLRKYRRVINLIEVENLDKFKSEVIKRIVIAKNQKIEDLEQNAFEKINKLNRELDIEGYYAQGISALFAFNDYDTAIECFDKAIEIEDQDLQSRGGFWNLKGIAFRHQGKYDEAIKCYDKAIETNPKYSLALFNKGVALEYKGKYYSAIKCFNKAIEIDPKYGLYWTEKGITFQKAENIDGALECFYKAIEIDPNRFKNLEDEIRKLLPEASEEVRKKFYDLEPSLNGPRTLGIDDLAIAEDREEKKKVANLGRLEALNTKLSIGEEEPEEIEDAEILDVEPEEKVLTLADLERKPKKKKKTITLDDLE